jgi:hypothetical protein
MSTRTETVSCPHCGANVETRVEFPRTGDSVDIISRSCQCEWTREERRQVKQAAIDADCIDYRARSPREAPHVGHVFDDDLPYSPWPVEDE